MITLRLTHAEAAALSAATLYSDGKKRHPALQSARVKIREALDGTKREEYQPDGKYSLRDAERYVNTEC